MSPCREWRRWINGDVYKLCMVLDIECKNNQSMQLVIMSSIVIFKHLKETHAMSLD